MNINAETIQTYNTMHDVLNGRVRYIGEKYYNIIYIKCYENKGTFKEIYDNSWCIFEQSAKDCKVILDISWYVGCGEYQSGTLEFPVNYLYDQDNVEEVMLADLKKIQEQKLIERMAAEAKKQEEKEKA